MCLCVVGCADLGGVLHRAGEFLDVARGAVVKPDVRLDGARAHVGFGATRGAAARPIEAILAGQGALRVRTTLYLWHRLLGWFAARPPPLEEVRFAFAAPPNGEAWPQLFGCPVRFDAATSALVLPRATPASR